MKGRYVSFTSLKIRTTGFEITGSSSATPKSVLTASPLLVQVNPDIA
jgi:hypothetical protein